MNEPDPGEGVRVQVVAEAFGALLGPSPGALVDGRTAFLSLLSIAIALAASLAAQGLTRLIWLVTHLAFFGQLSASAVSPAENRLGLWVIVVPVIGGIIVG